MDAQFDPEKPFCASHVERSFPLRSDGPRLLCARMSLMYPSDIFGGWLNNGKGPKTV